MALDSCRTVASYSPDNCVFIYDSHQNEVAILDTKTFEASTYHEYFIDIASDGRWRSKFINFLYLTDEKITFKTGVYIKIQPISLEGNSTLEYNFKFNISFFSQSHCLTTALDNFFDIKLVKSTDKPQLKDCSGEFLHLKCKSTPLGLDKVYKKPYLFPCTNKTVPPYFLRKYEINERCLGLFPDRGNSLIMSQPLKHCPAQSDKTLGEGESFEDINIEIADSYGCGSEVQSSNGELHEITEVSCLPTASISNVDVMNSAVDRNEESDSVVDSADNASQILLMPDVIVNTAVEKEKNRSELHTPTETGVKFDLACSLIDSKEYLVSKPSQEHNENVISDSCENSCTVHLHTSDVSSDDEGSNITITHEEFEDSKPVSKDTVGSRDDVKLLACKKPSNLKQRSYSLDDLHTQTIHAKPKLPYRDSSYFNIHACNIVGGNNQLSLESLHDKSEALMQYRNQGDGSSTEGLRERELLASKQKESDADELLTKQPATYHLGDKPLLPPESQGGVETVKSLKNQSVGGGDPKKNKCVIM